MKQKLVNQQTEEKEVYKKPQIEIIEMEIEDGILLSTSRGGDNYIPGGGGSTW